MEQYSNQIDPLHIPLRLLILTLQRTNSFKITYKHSVRTSQETHYISATKASRLMLFTEKIAFYCENHVKYTDTV
jgi:hypothetical protein